MKTTKLEELHDAVEAARDTEDHLRHRLIAAREEHGFTHPYVKTLQNELGQAIAAKAVALSAFSAARLESLRKPVRKANLKRLRSLAS